jgi:hexosaminidase
MGAPGFELSSLFTPAAAGGTSSYELFLKNTSDQPVSGFSLGFSGPGRIGRGAEIEGGTLISQLSNWCEIAAPRDLVLKPGATWHVRALRMDYALEHWTDGAAAGMVILQDGTVLAVPTRPSRKAGDDEPLRRGLMPLPVPEPAPAALSVVPWPKAVAVSGQRSAPDGFAIEADDAAGLAARAAFEELVAGLFPGDGYARSAEQGGYPVRLETDAEIAGEAYSIHFSHDRAKVLAGTQTGLLYGLVTLGQMLRGARLHPRSYSFPTAGRIEDAPELGFRGCHLDVARRFYSNGEIAQFLRILAWNKLNIFHWHLSDDEGWRIEIAAYPDLTAKGAWRGYGLTLPPLLGTGPERTGGYYTRAAIAELVALAGRLGIDVVPEIDIPGHCYAMLQALPQIRDNGENEEYQSVQGFPNNCLNPAVEPVYRAIETIFGEMCEMFPSRYFHVGADEVPSTAWGASPAARQLWRQLGTEGTGALQAHFLKRIQAFLTSRGKITGAWEEAAHGGGIEKEQAYLVGWKNPEISQRLAAEGYPVVIAPGQAYYLDMANGPEWAEPGAHWAGWSSPEKTYRFEPGEGWNAAERKRLMGVQGCIWNEPMSDRGVFDRLVFPRLSAIAETGWTAPDRRDYQRFIAAVGLMPTLFGIKGDR